MMREVRIERRGKAGLDAAEKLYVTRDPTTGERLLPAPTGEALYETLTAPLTAAATSLQQIGEQVEADAAAALAPVPGAVSAANTAAANAQEKADQIGDISAAVAASGASAQDAQTAALSARSRASGIPPKNLFNPATLTLGKIMPPDGVLADSPASPTYDVTDFIPVTPGQQYTASAPGNLTALRFLAYFDANKAVVPGGSSEPVSSFTPPVGAAFVRATVNRSFNSVLQIERGAIATAYEPYTETTALDPAAIKPGALTTPMLADKAVTVGKVDFLTLGKNLFNKATATIGAFLGHDGAPPVANATLDYSDFIAVSPNTQYSGRGATRGMRFVTFYNADKTFVPGGITDNSYPGAITFTTSAGVAYVRVTLYHVDLDSFQFEQAAAPTAFAPYKFTLGGPVPIEAPIPAASVATAALVDGAVTPAKASFLARGKNLFDKTKATLGFFRGHDGSTVASGTLSYSDFIPVTPGQQLVSNQSMRFTTFYSAAKSLITGGSSTSTTSITVPTNVFFVIITFTTTTIDAFQLEVGTSPTAYEAYGYKFTADILSGGTASTASGWTGKTWATLGDSITAGNTWQSLAANALGLIVTGFGIGGTKVSGPAGDANAMCQDTRINAIATTFDLITMMGGTNDWAQNVPLGAENSTDPLTFNGALNTFAAKAYARWPGKRIALATTPYGEIVDWTGRAGWTSPAHNSLGLTTNDYAEAVRKASIRHNLALIDVARNAGWGALNIEPALGGSTTDHLHPAAGSLAAKGIAAAHRGALRQIEPIA